MESTNNLPTFIKKHILLSCFSKLFSKTIFTFILLLSTICAQAQYFPTSNVSAEYNLVAGSCSGDVKIKFKTLVPNTSWLRNMNIYYKSASGTYTQIATITANHAGTGYSWWEQWGVPGGSWGHIAYYLSGNNGASVHFNQKNNVGSERFADVIWYNPPTDAINNGMIKIST